MKRLSLAVISIMALTAIGAFGWHQLHSRQAAVDAGPIPPSQPGGVTMIAKGIGIPVGAGALLFHNPADAAAVFDDVSLIDLAPGLKLVGVFLARAPQDTPQGAWGTTYWPPPGETLHPLAALPLLPHADHKNGRWVQLMIELKLTRRGHGSFRGVDIRYHIGNHRYELVDPFSVGVCYPKPVGDDCPLPHPVGVVDD
jgi:hypothetical protein